MNPPNVSQADSFTELAAVGATVTQCAPVLRHGNQSARLVNGFFPQGRRDPSGAFGCAGDDEAPGIANERVSVVVVSLPSRPFIGPPLPATQEVTLELDGPRPAEHFPMILACLQLERRGED